MNSTRMIREWLHAYYRENPVAWLLVKAETELRLAQIDAPAPAESGMPERRYQLIVEQVNTPAAGQRYFLWLDDWEFANAVKLPWYLPTRIPASLYELLYAVAATLIVIAVLLIYYGLRFPRPMVDVGILGTALACGIPLASTIPTMRVVASVSHLLSLEAGLNVALTRLRGRDVVRGVLVFAVPRAWRASAIYGLPVLFLIANIAHGTPWTGAIVATQLWLYGCALAPLFAIVMLAFCYGASRQGVTEWDEWARVVSYTLVIVAALAAGIYGVSTPLITTVPPLAEWRTLSAWWWGLVPPLGFASMLKVSWHPLWGLVPIVVAGLLSLAGWFVAERVLERGFYALERAQSAEVDGWE